MDTATLAAAMLASLLLMATMMVQPVAAAHDHEAGAAAESAGHEEAIPPRVPARQEPRRRATAAESRHGDHYAAPSQLATPDGGPGQFENNETADVSASNDLISGIRREYRTENKAVSLDPEDTGNTDMATSPESADIVMTGGEPGESSTAFDFHLEDTSE